MSKQVWVVPRGVTGYAVFTDKKDAEQVVESEGSHIAPGVLDPPIIRTYRVTAVMHCPVHWEAEIYGKAGVSKANGWSKYGRHGCATYDWDVQASSRSEAIEKAKQLFRDSI